MHFRTEEVVLKFTSCLQSLEETCAKECLNDFVEQLLKVYIYKELNTAAHNLIVFAFVSILV